MQTETAIRFVIRNTSGEYWTKYKTWSKDAASAYLFSHPAYAKISMKSQWQLSKTGFVIEQVEVVLKPLDTVYAWGY